MTSNAEVQPLSDRMTDLHRLMKRIRDAARREDLETVEGLREEAWEVWWQVDGLIDRQLGMEDADSAGNLDGREVRLVVTDNYELLVRDPVLLMSKWPSSLPSEPSVIDAVHHLWDDLNETDLEGLGVSIVGRWSSCRLSE